LDINEVYELCLYAINKFQGGGLTPAEFNRIINVGQRSYISYLLGSFQTYTPGRPIARVELGQNSVVRQRLTPSIYQYNLSVDANGFSPFPGDYLQADAMWSIYGYNRIRHVDQGRWWSTYNSDIDPIATNPIYMLKDIDGFQFGPESIGQAKLSYVRNPSDMIWGFDLDVNGREVYNPATSGQPIWGELQILEIIVRALRLIGVNLQADQVSQYATEIKMGGQ
jgi:hypothetical protein